MITYLHNEFAAATPPQHRSTPRKRKEPPASGSDSEADRSSRSPPEKKRRGKPEKATPPAVNGGVDVGKTDYKTWAVGPEKRSVPKADYNETTAHCPLPGCDSRGWFSRCMVRISCCIFIALIY